MVKPKMNGNNTMKYILLGIALLSIIIALLASGGKGTASGEEEEQRKKQEEEQILKWMNDYVDKHVKNKNVKEMLKEFLDPENGLKYKNTVYNNVAVGKYIYHWAKGDETMRYIRRKNNDNKYLELVIGNKNIGIQIELYEYEGDVSHNSKIPSGAKGWVRSLKDVLGIFTVVSNKKK